MSVRYFIKTQMKEGSSVSISPAHHTGKGKTFQVGKEGCFDIDAADVPQFLRDKTGRFSLESRSIEDEKPGDAGTEEKKPKKGAGGK